MIDSALTRAKKMKKRTADFVTGIRIFGSILLAFAPVFSVFFYALYLICGLSDMTDGIVARKTDSSSSFGTVLDTAADFLFAAVSLAKLLVHIPVPAWLRIWIAVIALIKVNNAVYGFIRDKRPISVHSVMNKATGLILFIFPLTLNFIDLRYGAAVVCSVATVSAVWEWHLIITGRALVTGQEGKADCVDQSCSGNIKIRTEETERVFEKR